MQLQFFPSRQISIYMGKLFIVRTFAVLAMLVMVLMALDMLGESGKILEVPGNDQGDLWHYAALRAPQIVARFLPFSVLLGTLITLATLNQNSEIIAMKASGLSAHQILAPMILASLLVAGISFTFNDHVVAPSTAQLKIWQDAAYKPVPKNANFRANIWVREGDDLIKAGRVTGSGAQTKLHDVAIYFREQGKLQQVIRAENAAYIDDAWQLGKVKIFDIATGSNKEESQLIIGRGIGYERFENQKVDGNALSFTQLGHAIKAQKQAGRRTDALEGIYWHKLAAPLSSLLMPLLGAVAAFGLARSGALFLRAVIGMALGFAYFVVDNFALAMGNLGAYSPPVAAWAPFLLFFLIGETVLIRTEE
ncbi:LPS export ABC transporter permease LptG [Sphingorhabdus lutea]|uniref:LPS export ABC transporter permease LptG n=1 Tax=Sphingorhabdus lutea TaxID=1913578 RepID=A0A1L3JAE7_9SPHN|nr:LPS export ABC transporter permease LptG [Sphingorhabdus lutea]APG62110.1 LPS export ABC transporter permease LptG [Sphingorhabdus lutea]